MIKSTTPNNELNLQGIFASAMAGFGAPKRLCVAVSGGADSMALLHLSKGWAAENSAELYALTVNHGLRAAAADEAEMVARWCAENAVPHSILLWEHGGDATGNLQAEARKARYRLMGEWCTKHDCNVLLTAHQCDDQAETVLMRLMRGSGVDGLAAMAAETEWPGPQMSNPPRLYRPLLAARRAALRAYVGAHHLPYVDDPSNEDESFDRVAMRGAIKTLRLDVPRLARTAQVMQAEQQALSWAATQAAKTCIQISSHGFVAITQTELAALPQALAFRLIRHIVQTMGAGPYAPARERLERFAQAAKTGQAATLAGLAISAGEKGQSLIYPEQPPAAMPLRGPGWQNWGRRFAFNSGGQNTGNHGGEIVPRAALAASALGDENNRLISALPAPVRPSLPVLKTADGAHWLPSFGLMPVGMRIKNTLDNMF